jgi:hypothetical protein
MSGLGVQDAIVMLAALAAASWLVARAIRRRGSASGCEHCPSAAAGRPACQTASTDALVTIAEPRDPAPSRQD